MNLANKSSPWAENGELIKKFCEQLPAYLLRQRWYPAKNSGLPLVKLSSLREIKSATVDAALAIWSVLVSGQPAFKMCIPVAIMPLSRVDHAKHFTIGTWEHDNALVDAVGSDDFVRAFVGLMKYDPGGVVAIERSKVEQSNTSLRIGEAAMLKLLRKLSSGINPEFEMGRFLTSHLESGVVPAMLGALEAEGSTIAVLQSFVPNEGDGWTWILKHLSDTSSGSLPPVPPWIRTLGRRTAEMHAALTAPTDDPDFAAEPASDEDWSCWIRGILSMMKRVREVLERQSGESNFVERDIKAQFEARAMLLEQHLATLIPKHPAYKSRLHGDFHLGQVLVHGQDVTIVDFEGEPLRSLAERRAKQVPLKDVAGMLRSFAYAAASVETPSRSMKKWAERASAEYLESYFATLEFKGRGTDRAESVRMLQLFSIEKSLYEISYELANRPTWVHIPLKGFLSLTDDSNRSIA